ncbi:MAG: phasin family protein [Qipengyuania sp.]
MTDSQIKIDAAAEKAYADAAEKKAAEQVSVKAVAKAVETDKSAPAKAAKVARAVVAPKTSKKTASRKKPATRKNSAAAKRPATRTSTNKAARTAPTKLETPKDTIMTKTNTNDFTQTVKQAAAEAQTRLKTAYDKGTELTGELAEFQKANVEALVESGKILAAGMQDLGRVYIEEAKSAAETVTGDVKQMAAIKSPTELFQLQGEIARRNFEAAVAQTSKNAEAMMKLANDVFAPLSSRASRAAENFSKAA